MSLNWTWKNVVGEIEREDNKPKIFIYEGNAFLIFISETKEEYCLYNFFADERHAKNCLGLSKDYEGMAETFKNEKYILSSESKNCMKFVQLLSKAKIQCEIKIVEKYESELHKSFHNNYDFKKDLPW